MPSPVKDWIDKLLNWSGGSYVGLATLTVLGLGIAEFISGTPMVVAFPDGRAEIFIIHTAPNWLVTLGGIYMAILGLFWLGKPVNTYIAQRGNPPPEPAPSPPERPLEQ